MKLNKNDFRVLEYDGLFHIQRKQTKEIITGILWWRKTASETVWKSVTNRGVYEWSRTTVAGRIGNSGVIIKPFTDLKSAIDKINIIVGGVKYHYL